MLGIKSEHRPLEGEDAKRLMETVVRIMTNSPNEEEKAQLEREKEIRKRFNVIWKD